ncbi:FKBP-like protein [Piromyces finnis]|uniref:peptidylprolyl isomerase n=1 Tax=Piromyces finnis TaxID=1754191 RepID=A0A1Y1V717_9FUNG|nr:FKBP-like protein [Piromyces finnis]|eukprot:ORX48915.1 FKBP-like protein [Piromyces finnis]
MSTQEEFQGCPGGCCGGCPSAGACGGCEGCPNAGSCGGCPNAGGCGGCEGCPNAGSCGGCEGCPNAGGCGCGDCQQPEEQCCGCGCCGCEGEAPYQTYGVDEEGYILLTEDGGVKKKIIKEGTGDFPPAGSKVTVHYDGYLYPSGDEFDSSRKRHSPFTFNLSKGEVIRAWDIGIATIRRGEQASLLCAPEYAYGESGSPPSIPGNSTLRFEIEGLNIEPPHQTIAERIESATKSKEEGNALFKEKKFEEAIQCYQQGIKTLDYRWGATPVEEKNIETLRVNLNSNAAMCSLKINNLNDTVNFCNAAIELDPFNTKALYRLSEAYIGQSNFEKAIEVINKCLEINPDDALFKRQAAICKKKEKEFKTSEKKMYAKMFS